MTEPLQLTAGERVPPHSLDAEKAILGALLVNERLLSKVTSLLTPADFYRDAHQRIFKAMLELADQEVMLDFLTVREQLRSEGELDEVGGQAYLAALTDGVPMQSHVEDYAKIVREKARLRALAQVGTRLAERAYAEEPSREVAQHAVQHLLRASSAERTLFVRIRDAVSDYMAAMSGETLAEAVATGYADLDELIGGWQPGELAIVAARPSVGKSSFALRSAAMASDRGVSSAFFSLEMGLVALASQVMAWRSGVPTTKLKRKTATDGEYRAVSDAWAAMGDPPLLLNESAHTITQVAAWCHRLKEESGITVAYVDYLQLLLPDERSDSRQDDVAAISRGLKAVARDLGIAVVALSQLKRPPDKRADKRPLLADLRESGALEQDADLVVLLHRPEMYKRTEENEGIAEVIVAKNRMGPTGPVRLFFHKALAKFANLDVRRE